MRAAIYARVSTGEQNPENQVVALREYVLRAGHQLVAVYTDVQSGASERRPGLDRMLADAAHHRFELLVFWSLDRLTRRGVLSTFKILERLDAYGVKFRALQQPELDTSGPWGHVIVALLAAVAQVEREQIRQRTCAGIRRARAQGKRLGRPRRPLDLDRALQLIEQGGSLRQAADALRVSPTTLRRRLQESTRNTAETSATRTAPTSTRSAPPASAPPTGGSGTTGSAGPPPAAR